MFWLILQGGRERARPNGAAAISRCCCRARACALRWLPESRTVCSAGKNLAFHVARSEGVLSETDAVFAVTLQPMSFCDKIGVISLSFHISSRRVNATTAFSVINIYIHLPTNKFSPQFALHSRKHITSSANSSSHDLFQILTAIILPVLFYEFSAARADASPERSASDSDFANTAKHLMQASNTTQQYISPSSMCQSKSWVRSALGCEIRTTFGPNGVVQVFSFPFSVHSSEIKEI